MQHTRRLAQATADAVAVASASSSRPSPYAWRNPAPRPAASGPLAGRAIAVKENISYMGAPTTCSSLMLQDYRPPSNATCVDALLAAGAHIVGTTKMDEFGMGSQTTHLPPGYTPVHNPAGPAGAPPRSAGGSSGGSAAAVAEGSCWAALGTDTGGSVRLPASYCGVVGLKPSYGLVSRAGVVAYADSLDCVGVLGATVDVVEQVFDIISQPDERDMTCAPAARRGSPRPPPAWAHSPSDLSGLRIGLPVQTHLGTPASLPPALLAALAERGAQLVALDMPALARALPAYYVLAAAEAASNLGRFGGGWFGAPWEGGAGGAGGRGEAEGAHGSEAAAGESAASRRVRVRTAGFGLEVKKRILAGTYALTADAFNNSYLKALHLRRLLRREFAAALDAAGGGVDLILHATAVQAAPELPGLPDVSVRGGSGGGGSGAGGSGASDVPGSPGGAAEYAQDILTVPASLAGLPALSVPAGTARGWPVGASVVGPWGGERAVCALGRVIERLGV